MASIEAEPMDIPETAEAEGLPEQEEKEPRGSVELKPVKVPDVVVDPLLTFRCKNHVWGCLFEGNLSKLRDHEAICDQDVDDCPLNAVTGCGWRGHEEEFHGHCSLAHPGLQFCTNGRCLMWPNFVNITDENRRVCLLLLAYHELFYCVWEVSEADGLVRWAVYFMGEPEEASNYRFEVDFEGEPINKGCYCIKRRCEPLVDKDVSFKEDGCGIIYYKMLKNLCARDELVYIVRIRKVVEGGSA